MVKVIRDMLIGWRNNYRVHNLGEPEAFQGSGRHYLWTRQINGKEYRFQIQKWNDGEAWTIVHLDDTIIHAIHTKPTK